MNQHGHASIEDLYERWQKNPDAAETMALCEALRGGRRPDLIEIVGSHASRQLDVGALLAAARMYTDSGRLDDAQTVLLSAGRIAPRDGHVYRWLGEVLLRRGDAERAEKVLEKAVQFGSDSGAAPLLERARALVPTQRASGQAAVAEAVARSGSPFLQKKSVPPPRLPPPKPIREVHGSGSGAVGTLRGRLVPADSDEDVETQIRKNDEVKSAIEAALAPIAPPAPIPAAGRPASVPPQRPSVPPMNAPPPSVPPPPMSLGLSHGRPRNMPPIPPADDLIFTTPTRGIGFDIQPKVHPGPNPFIQTRDNEVSEISEISSSDLLSDVVPLPTGAVPNKISASTAAFGSARVQPAPTPAPAASGPIPQQAVPASLQGPRPIDERTSESEGPSSAMPLKAAGGLRAPMIEPAVNPLLLEALARPPVKLGGAHVPEPRDVLDALQIAGVYEPEGAVGPQVYTWAKPQGLRRIFSTVTLITLAVVLVGGGIGGYYYVNDKRAKQHVEAEGLLAIVDKDLESSDARKLDGIEKSISRAFELESRSSHASLTWLHERALVGLLKGGADLAFEDAVQRAKAVGVPEKKIAFAHVASFLYQGDTAGAAAMVAKWDPTSQDDAWFNVMAGATFERAGDSRAIERYSAAVKLDPELVIAQILLSRALAVEGDYRRAHDLAKELRGRFPDRQEPGALIVLAWTRDPLRGEQPTEMKDLIEKGNDLPVCLRSVPHAARAILSLHKGAVDEARPSLQKGLDVADTPGIAAWLGSIALVMGDETLARKAALSAVAFSAVYPPARILAARVALLGARLDEALKATEDLPPQSIDIAIVTAAASYEKLDGERMKVAFDAIPDEAKKMPFTVPLVRGQALLNGNLAGLTSDKVVDMADDEAPWADLVAMDWVLDVGDLDLAKKIADQWRGEPRSMRAVRLARLSRYDGKLDDADKLSRAAMDNGTVTLRVLAERVFTLVALKKDTEALALFKTYPNVGGPLAKWLRAYATAAHGKIEEARAIVGQEDPPSAAAPMPSRTIAAMAFAMMKDARHGNEYTRPIVQAGFTNPDVAAAAERVGLPKVTRRAKW